MRRHSIPDAAEAKILVLALNWAALHPADSPDHDESDGSGDRPVTLAGPGAPRLTQASVSQFAEALGLPADQARAYVAEALELGHRLHTTYGRVVAGDLPAWRASRIARATMPLSREAAAHVDEQVAPLAHTIRPVALRRLVRAAIARSSATAHATLEVADAN